MKAFKIIEPKSFKLNSNKPLYVEPQFTSPLSPRAPSQRHNNELIF